MFELVTLVRTRKGGNKISNNNSNNNNSTSKINYFESNNDEGYNYGTDSGGNSSTTKVKKVLVCPIQNKNNQELAMNEYSYNSVDLL